MANQSTKLIGIDARFYGEAGPGRYVKNIIQHLEMIDDKNKYLIFLREKGFKDYQPKNANFTKVLAPYTWYSFQEQIQFLFTLLKFRLNLLYVPHFNVPVLYPGKLVTAIPDIIMHTFSTEKGTTLPKPYFKLKKLIYYWVVFWAIYRSKKVIVPSNDVKSDLLNTYKSFKPSKFVLAYEGVDPDILLPNNLNVEEVLKKYSIKLPFLLYVSSFYEHKNVERLINAFYILINRFNYSGQLVLVGKNDKFSQKLNEQIASLKLQDRVVMPGMKSYVTDAEVAVLRKTADLYVFPSLKEGFSLTPLEAMAFGLPAVISDIPCHKEIYNNSAEYFDPYNTNEMVDKINEVLTNETLKTELIKRGYEQIKKYNWTTTAQITLNEFNVA